MNKMYVSSALILAAASQILSEEPKSDSLLQTKPKTIAVFKNGLGFVYRAGSGNSVDGLFTLGELPNSTLGSLWINSANPEQRVLEVAASRQKELVNEDALSLSEILEANENQEVTLTFSEGSNNSRSILGTILSTPRDRALTPSAIEINPRLGYPASVREPQRAEIVLVRSSSSGDKWAINKSSILSVHFKEGNIKKAMEKDVIRTRVKLENNPETADLSMVYLQKGWNWSPSYLVNIAHPQEAEVTMEAVFANDIEDLEDVDISFVAGYPNFIFADFASPLSIQQSVATFVQALASGSRALRDNPYGLMTQNGVAYNAYGGGENLASPGNYSVSQSAPGETSEDLFFYHQPKVTLAKGGRARYVLFTARIPYEHVYNWEIPDTLKEDYNARNDLARHLVEVNQVWHTIRLKNSGKQPWTTAPAFTVNKNLPIAQDTLKYTPTGAVSSLKITVASDVRAEQSQIEKDRKPVDILGSRYFELSIEGQLKIKNWKVNTIKVCVKKQLDGNVQNSGSGKATKRYQQLNALNPSSEIEWDFDLTAGDEKELKYDYTTLSSR